MKTTIVAEIGSNWEGDLAKAKKLIFETKRAGADAVKFQMWRANDLYSRDITEWKLIKKSEISFDVAEKMKKYADKVGIEFFCSVFYPEAVDFLESLGVKRYKVASRTCIKKDPYAQDVLKKKSETGKPIIISMGLGGNKRYIENIFSKNKTIFCYCVSEYPLKIEKINWKCAIKFKGFSDHTLGITAPILFTILKKQQKAQNIYIEKHVRLKNSKGPDALTSIDVKQLHDLVSHVRLIEKIKF